MPKVLVTNISGHPQSGRTPRAINILGTKLRPGKSIEVEKRDLSKKLVEKLNGSVLWIGDLPSWYTQVVVSAPVVEGVRPMTLAEAREYLAKKSLGDLLELCKSVTPPLEFAEDTPHIVVLTRLSRTLFIDSKTLDPEVFFWLRRWTRSGTYGEVDYVEVVEED